MAEWLKRAEIPAALIAGAGFITGWIPVLFVALALYGAIAALFGPIKYGILPQHLDEKEVPAGNALVESATFAAILLGTVAGNYAAAHEGVAWYMAAAGVTAAVLCWLSAKLIPRKGAAAPDLIVDKNIFTSTGRLITSFAPTAGCGSAP